MNSPETRHGAANPARNTFWRAFATITAGAAVAGLTIAAAPAPAAAPKAAAAALPKIDTHHWRPMLFAAPPTADHRARLRMRATMAGVTVPYWSTQITSPLDHQTYDVSMVGSSPYDAHPHNTNVTYVPVVLRIHLGGQVLDPTAVSHCDTQSPARRFFNSPLFRPNTFVSNGVNVSAVPGGTQIISAYQRANFWNSVKGTTYGVTLIPSRLDPIVVDWFPQNPQDSVGTVPDNCGGQTLVAFTEINEFDAELQTVAATYAQPNQIPTTLANDVAIYIGSPGNCCVLGYHNAIPVAGGTQLYAVGAYFDTIHAFGPHFADTTVWVHELGELIDDPFVQSINGVPGGVNNDLTPAWGHTGQVGGCQNNLENGDPLTPDQGGNFPNYGVTGTGGYVYHYQDLAFHDWFYRTPSSSTGGKYSFVGNFSGVQGACS
ncbi:MAG: hypothetical protein ABI242_12770 [Caulobacteraceae bacterium]